MKTMNIYDNDKNLVDSFFVTNEVSVDGLLTRLQYLRVDEAIPDLTYFYYACLEKSESYGVVETQYGRFTVVVKDKDSDDSEDVLTLDKTVLRFMNQLL